MSQHMGHIGTGTTKDGDIDIAASARLLSSLTVNSESDVKGTTDDSLVENQADEGGSYPSDNCDPVSIQDPCCIIVHQVDCAGSSPGHSRHPESRLFLDEPRLYKGDNKANPLRGLLPVHDLPSYLAEHPEISIIIFRSYRCIEYHDLVFEGLQGASLGAPMEDTGRPVPRGPFVLAQDAKPALPEREHMKIHSQGLREVMSVLQASRSDNQALLSGWEREHNMLAPYLHFYHIRGLLREERELLSAAQRRHLDPLLEYLDSQFRREYDAADRLFKNGYVTRDHVHKLFGPGEVLVTVQDGHPIAMVAKQCPLPGSYPIKLDCEVWEFDGRFTKNTKRVTLRWPQGDHESDKFPISSLPVYPLRLDRDGMEARLRKRGATFWSCRKRQCVGYDEGAQKSEARAV